MRIIRVAACLIALLICRVSARASLASDAAIALFEQHHFREAEAALRNLIKVEPANAAAYHTLAHAIIAGMANAKLEKSVAEARTEDAAQWLARAAELEPHNAAYVRDLGLSRVTGATTLKSGRKIVEQALALDPKDPDTHHFLSLMYDAPWLLGGDKEKAEEHRRAFQLLDPIRFAINEINRYIWIDKNFPAAFDFCEALLKKEPENALGYCLYGYVAAESKSNLERGLTSLKKALALPRPVSLGNSVYDDPFIAAPSYGWEQIGKIERQLNHPDAARAAFSTAVELDPANYWAREALAKLKS